MQRKNWILIAVACGTFMATLDSSIVNIALPTLTADLEASLPSIKWVIVIYFLGITCLLLPFGRLSDKYGRKNIFTLGFFIFTLGSALCGLSPNLTGLLIFRLIQAFGAAMLMANGPAIITEAFLPNERGGALGKLAMVVSLGLISGPGLGGWLVSEMGWRSIFLINVPFGLIGILLVYLCVPQDVVEVKRERGFDWMGSLLQSFLLIVFILMFEPPHLSVVRSLDMPYSKFILFLILLILLFWFIWVEKRAKEPIFDFTLLENRTFWTANLASFFIFVAYSSFAVLIPYFFEHALHLSTSKSGQLMTAIPIAIFIIAPISGRLSDLFGSKELCIAGAAIETATLFLLAGVLGQGLDEHIGTAEVLTALCAIGLGMGLFQSPNNNAIMGTVPKDKLSVASALIATIRNLGLFTGVGFGTSIFSWKGQESGNMIEALHFSFLCAGIAGVCAVIASLGKTKNEKQI